MSLMDKLEDEAKEKCTKEFVSFLKRWEMESDLGSQDILNCVSDAIDECYEEVVEFDSEIDLDDEE
jgi:uncharacterized protein with ParB-like and HNH nuclease domain